MLKTSLMVPALLLASTSAFAQVASQPAAGADDADITDIIVTAQKREQSLQDVSAAVSAVGADRLAAAQVNNISDLQTIVPSVNFGSDFNQAKIFIRGVGANPSTSGSSTGVALHVDGAYVARAEAQLTSLFDLERVEVLRGPQGSLYGRNAVGGSVNLITAKPTRDFSGYARMTYGNYDQLTSELAISGPITENILFRVAGKMESRDGFGTNPVTGADVDDLKRRMARAQVQFNFTDDVSLLLSGEYFRQDDSSGAVHYLRDSFPGVARLASLGAGGYAAKPRDLATEIQPGTDTKSYSFTGTFRAQLSDTVTLTNIANYRNFKTSLFQDLDLSAVVDAFPLNGMPTTIHERRIDSEQVSNELQLNYSSDFVNIVVGGYYFHERQRPIDNVGYQRRNGLAGNLDVLERDAGLLAAKGMTLADVYELCGYGPGTTTSGDLIAPKRVCTKSNLGDTAYAFFGQANLDFGMFSDSLAGVSLKLGGRYSHEKVTTENPSVIVRYAGPTFTPATALPTLVFNAADSHNERSFNDFTPEIGLQYQPNRDLLFYYTYSEGFKAGSGENASNSSTIVDPETIKNHEAGIKASFGRVLTVNLAGYAYTLNGLQLNKTIAGGPTGYTTIFQNAAKTRAKGIEADVLLRPARGLRISGALSYTDAHFVDYLTLDPLNPANIAGGTPYDPVTNPDPTAFGAPSGGNIQLAGNDTRNSPRWAWNLHGEYDIRSTVGLFTPSIDISYKSRTYFSEYERAIESSRAYTMVDASLAYETDDGRIRAQIWAKNLFDVTRPGSTFALATGRLLGVTWLPPRTYGATIGYKF